MGPPRHDEGDRPPSFAPRANIVLATLSLRVPAEPWVLTFQGCAFVGQRLGPPGDVGLDVRVGAMLCSGGGGRTGTGRVICFPPSAATAADSAAGMPASATVDPPTRLSRTW